LQVPTQTSADVIDNSASAQQQSSLADRFGSGVMLAVAGTFFFALKSIFIKFAFAVGATPVLLLTIRLLFSLPFYIGVLIYLRRDPNRKAVRSKDITWALVAGFFGFYLASILDLYGLQLISAQLERLTLFTYPTIVAVMAWLFLGEQLDRKIIAAIVTCYAGVIVMYSGERTLTSGADLGLGVLYVLGAAISYALYILMAKPRLDRIGSRAFTSWAMIGSTFYVCVQFFSTQDASSLFTAEPMVYVYGMILGFVCTVLPSFMINEAIVRLGVTRTTIIGSVGPALTMILAIVLLSEPSSPRHFAGMILAIIGVSLATRP
jgi:drug/metabolite transporter (DMT)-like permease